MKKISTARDVGPTLTEKERRIISICQHRGQDSIGELAALTGYSQHIVRYHLESLQERKILQRQVYLDVYRLGLSYNTLCFSLVPGVTKQVRRLITYLKESPRVAYFVALGGEFDFCIDICVREMIEFLEFLQELSTNFGALFNNKSLTSIITLTDYPLDLGEGGRSGQTPLTLGIRGPRASINELDHQILSLLSNRAELGTRDMAQMIGISESTLAYRIKRLESSGVIRGYRYFAASNLFGLQSFMHCIYLRGLSKKLRQLLVEFCQEHPAITYHLECAGNWDFEFGSSVFTAHEVTDLLHDLQLRFGEGISQIKTLPLFSVHKVSKYPFPLTFPVEHVVG
jgi:DNA-binding Lrp family transcriptional regulator